MYTTPLKALSNQKYQDLQKRFGRERVGLMTGDACLNAESEILVMTTEVFRNMLLEDDQARSRGSGSGSSSEMLLEDDRAPHLLHYTTHRTLHYTYYRTQHYTYNRTLITLTIEHYTTLDYTIEHYTTLHYTTLHYTTLHYTTLTMLLEDEQARLAGVAYVVLDEFHYMNDPSRGTVRSLTRGAHERTKPTRFQPTSLQAC